ncbi:zinc-dependent metalloprotease [Yeosuana sp.]|uniref:zinc-dependent metalloprotease n=1 Tax=Yeosuana sp. TaxID=2529388 RepID=UPI0040550654
MTSQLTSQNNLEPVCGTVTTLNKLEQYNTLKPLLKKYETEFMTMKSSQSKSSAHTIYSIPIKAHIIRTSGGTDGLNDGELKAAIATLNSIFSESSLEFILYGEINYIDNDNFYHFKSNEEKALVETNNLSGLVNIYFTDYIENTSDESICGYAHNEENYDVIIMNNSCATNGTSLAHELGHFFSLIHTHGIYNDQLTKEFVNGKNCNEEGDQICDTPADPKLTSKNQNNFCRYVGDEKDCNGDTFTPDTGNIMSYSMKGCRSYFSKQQLSRMYAYYLSVKNYLNMDTTSNLKNVVGNEKSGKLNIKIFPNPISGDVLYMQPNSFEEPLKYEITNFMGQVYKSGTLTNQPIQVDQLASGTYLVTVKNKNSKVVKKIIK